MLLLVTFGCKDTEEKMKGDIVFPNGWTNEIHFDSDGGDETITFNPNMDWTVSVDEDWLKVAPMSGVAGKGEITISVGAYLNDRDATLDRKSVV